MHGQAPDAWQRRGSFEAPAMPRHRKGQVPDLAASNCPLSSAPLSGREFMQKWPEELTESRKEGHHESDVHRQPPL